MKNLILLTAALSLTGHANQSLIEDTEVRANGFGTGHIYESTAHALLSEASPNENQGGYLTPEIIPLNPPGTGDLTQLAIRYDDLIGPEIWQIPMGSHITRAQLVLPFTDPAGHLVVSEILHPWDPETATWNNFSPDSGNGLGFPDEGTPFLEQPLAFQPTFIDITPLVQVWANNPDENNGLVLQRVEGIKGFLKGFNFLDPSKFNHGLFTKVPSGETGLHAPYYLPEIRDLDLILTDPTLLTDVISTRPILIIDFELPPAPDQPMAGAFTSDPQIFPPVEVGAPPFVMWEARPGTKFEPLFSPDMQPGGWFRPPGLFARFMTEFLSGLMNSGNWTFPISKPSMICAIKLSGRSEMPSTRPREPEASC